MFKDKGSFWIYISSASDYIMEKVSWMQYLDTLSLENILSGIEVKPWRPSTVEPY